MNKLKEYILANNPSSFEINEDIVLMSIKPKYANMIFDNIKLVEFRKKSFKKAVDKIIVYSSSPMKRVIGIIHIDEILTENKEAIWLLTKHIGGITNEEFNDYYSGHENATAICIKKVQLFANPINPSIVVSNFIAPQSFFYL